MIGTRQEDELRRATLLRGSLARMAPERHYVQFDGIVDYAYAEGVIGELGSSYAVVVKLAAGNPVGSFKTIAHLSDPLPEASFGNYTDGMQVSGAAPQYYRAIGLKTDGTTNHNRQSSSDGALVTLSEGVVLCIARDLMANTARYRVVRASDQALYWNPVDLGSVVDSAPKDLALGCGLTRALVPADSSYSPIRLVAAAVLSKLPTNSELQLYASPLCRDAKKVWGPSDLRYYVTASSLAASNPAAPSVGVAPLVFVGPTTADLVPL